MDKLTLPPSGGYLLNSEDLEFELNAHREAFMNILKPIAAMNNGYMVVSGCVRTRTGLTETISAGYVVINYELCAFAGGSFSYVDGEYYSLVLAETNDPQGQKNLANGTSYNGLKRRRAVIVTEGEGLVLNEGNYYDSLLKRLLDSSVSLKHFVIPIANWTNSSNAPLTAEKRGLEVRLDGNLNVGTLTENFTKVSTLPTDYRPKRQISFAVPVIGGGLFLLEIQPDGSMYFKNLLGDIDLNRSGIANVTLSYMT